MRRSLIELLDEVCDRASFIAFMQALAQERQEAEDIERADSRFYDYGGALGWQNSTISSFLEAAVACFEANDEDTNEEPSWRLLAEFLYGGKIYE